MHCKVVEIITRRPDPGEFGYEFCRDHVRYISFKTTNKSINWCLGHNQFKQEIAWTYKLGGKNSHISSLLPSLTLDTNIIAKPPAYINNGSLDWDEAQIPATGLPDIMVPTKLNAFAGINVDFLNKYGKKLLVLGKGLTTEAFTKELQSFVKIISKPHLIQFISFLTQSRFNSDNFLGRKDIVNKITGTSPRAAIQVEQELGNWWTKNAPLSGEGIKLQDILPVEVHEILGFMNSSDASSLSVGFIDIRALWKVVTTDANDITDNKPIYLGKIPTGTLPKQFIIAGVRDNAIQCFGLLKNQGSPGFKFELLTEYEYQISNKKCSVKKEIIPDIKHGRDIIELIKKTLSIESRNQGSIRNISQNDIDTVLDCIVSTTKASLVHGTCDVEIIPVPAPTHVNDYNSSWQAKIPISLKEQNVIKVYPCHRNTYAFSHDTLTIIDEIVCNSVWKIDENGKKTGLKWLPSNKANITVSEKRREIANKLAGIYTLFEPIFRFQLKAALRFPNITRSHIVISNDKGNFSYPTNSVNVHFQSVESDTHKDILLSTVPTVGMLELYKEKKSLAFMEEKGKEVFLKDRKHSFWKNLHSICKSSNPLVFVNLLSIGENIAAFKSNKFAALQPPFERLMPDDKLEKFTDSNFTIEMKIDGDLCSVKYDILRYEEISALMFETLLFNSIENEAMLNLQGTTKKLTTNADIINSTLEDNQYNVLTLMRSIYA